MFSSRWSGSGSLVSLSGLLRSAPAVGFSGSRRGFLPGGEVAFCSVAALVPAGAVVSVGCARGVDESVRSWFPSASVFRVAPPVSRGSFAVRSVAMVQSVSRAGGVLVCFPGEACPLGLVPSGESRSCFAGFGSGSWASAAFAAGLGVPVLVWLPRGWSVPQSWGFESVGGGWWLG